MISEGEAAKYPFLKDAVALVKTLDINLDDLIDPSYSRVLDRAENRISQAILSGETTAELDDALSELVSFPIGNIFITAISDEYLYRRYSLAEAVRAYKLLLDESEERLAKIARLDFDWNLRLVQKNLDGRLYRFEIFFKDYLRNTTRFREPEWKIINRLMHDGYVLLTKREVSRLLQEEIQNEIANLFSGQRKLNLPEPFRGRLNRLQKLLDENRSKLTEGDLPSDLIMEALPPCIKRAFEGLLAGRRESHMERFALVSFLINAGMNIENIVRLFVSVTDFDEQFTRYQIEHIAGLRGGRTKYTPPNCSTLKTHGVCYNPDQLCEYIRHPLSYYRAKIYDSQRGWVEKEAPKE